jgi:hypothetical protein
MADLPRRSYILAKRQKVIDNWATIIERGAGRDTWFLGEVEKMVIDADMTGLRSSQMNVQSGIFGQARPFLVVSLERLRKHTMFIGARDFGAHLDISWFVTLYQGRIENFLFGKSANNPRLRMTVFSQQDLSAFTFVVHRCVLEAARMLMEELSLDPTGMNTKSNGFLSVW